MKMLIRAISIAAVLTAPINAAERPKHETLTTTSGLTYNNVVVNRVTPAAIHIFHETGAASIPLGELTPELQEKYGYDPEVAMAFESEQAAARARADKAEAERESAAKLERARATEAEAERLRVAELERSAKRIGFYVAQVLEEGLLVNNVEYRTVASGSARIGGGGGAHHYRAKGTRTHFVSGYPDHSDLTDGVYIVGMFYEDGNHSYTDVTGARRTVKKFVFARQAPPRE